MHGFSKSAVDSLKLPHGTSQCKVFPLHFIGEKLTQIDALRCSDVNATQLTLRYIRRCHNAMQELSWHSEELNNLALCAVAALPGAAVMIVWGVDRGAPNSTLQLSCVLRSGSSAEISGAFVSKQGGDPICYMRVLSRDKINEVELTPLHQASRHNGTAPHGSSVITSIIFSFRLGKGNWEIGSAVATPGMYTKCLANIDWTMKTYQRYISHFTVWGFLRCH